MRIVATLIVSILGAGAALAEPVPLPSVDYVAKGNMGARGTLTVRHHEGKLRTDMMMAGMPIPVLMLVDLKARKALIHMPMPGSQGAMEVDFGEGGALGQLAGGEGTRTGTATVGGEPCDLWQIASRRSAQPLVACITADGIHLLTQVTHDGERQVVMELTEVTRAPQDAALFELPPGTPIVKPPPGMSPPGGPPR